MKAYKHLIKYALGKGCTISVFDGEEWQVKGSKKFKEITEAIESVEEAQLRIVDPLTNNRMGWALVSPFGLEDDETVIDASDNWFMNDWSTAYELITA